jgi:hypothetical protein
MDISLGQSKFSALNLVHTITKCVPVHHRFFHWILSEFTCLGLVQIQCADSMHSLVHRQRPI